MPSNLPPSASDGDPFRDLYDEAMEGKKTTTTPDRGDDPIRDLYDQHQEDRRTRRWFAAASDEKAKEEADDADR